MKKSILAGLVALFVLTTGCSNSQPQPTPSIPASSASETASVSASETSAPVEATTTMPLSKTESSFIYAKSLKLDWNYSVYLPEGYDKEENAQKKYPVIYMLHGGYGTHRDYIENYGMQEMLDQLIENKELPETIVVFPDGFISYYVNGPALAMEDAIIKDLIPQMEAKYRINAEKESRVIGGLSNGAYGASRFAIKYPTLFKGAFLLSPAVWEIPENCGVLHMNIFAGNGKGFSQDVWNSYHPERSFDDYVKANSPVEFLIITGDKDPTTTPEMVTAFNDKLSKIAKTHFSIEPGAHEVSFWIPALKESLQFAGTLFQSAT